jgi:hypothetical protein
VSSVRVVEGGPLAVGKRVRIRQPKLPPAEWRVTRVEPDRGFTWVSRAPGILVTGSHEIEPRDGGSHVTLSLHYAGLLGPLLARVTREVTLRYIAMEASGLRARSEGR